MQEHKKIISCTLRDIMADDEFSGYQSGLPGPLGWLDLAISKLEAFLLAAGVLLMALNTVSNVVTRTLFDTSLMATEDINRLLIVLITFAGIGYAARHGRHIRMSAFYDLLPDKGRQVLMIIISLFTATVMFTLGYYSIGYIGTEMRTGRVLPALGLETWIIYLWAPVGFFITGIQYVLTAVKNWNEDEVYLSTHVDDTYDEVDDVLDEYHENRIDYDELEEQQRRDSAETDRTEGRQ